MPLCIRKDITDALKAAREGSTVDLSGLVIPRSGGSVLVQKEPLPDRTRFFMWSDKSVDRDNDSIDPFGWKLDRFYENGAILWAHNGKLPTIGIPRDFRVERVGDIGQLRGGIEFSSVNPFAEMLLGLIDEGALKNVSVGFLPLKWHVNQERQGIDFLEQELVEGSLVPVGSNPNAMLRAANQNDIDLAPMQDWAEKWLDEDESVAACVVDPEDVQVIYKALKGWTKSDAGVLLPEAVADPVTEAVADPVTEAVADPVTEAVADPATDVDGTCVIENMLAAIERGDIGIEDVEKALDGVRPEPEITREEIRKAVKDALLSAPLVDTVDGVDEEYVRRILVDELRKLRSDFLRESGRLPN